MSIQPSLHSRTEINHRGWQQLLDLAEVLSSHFTLSSLLDYTTRIIEEKFACQTSIWLDSTKLTLINKDLHSHPALGNKRSSLMEQAWCENRIVHKDEENDSDRNDSSSIAIPLIAREQTLGVIQLDQIPSRSKTAQDIYNSFGFISQIALAIYELGYQTHGEFLQKKIAHLTAIEEISKSILSNLVWESLLNSTLSIIHLMFHFPRAMLLIARSDDNHAFKKVEIAQDGLKIDPLYQLTDEVDPITWSISNLEPLAINNVTLDERFSKHVFDKNTRSEAILPLLNGEVLIGVLVLISDAVDAFGPDSITGFHLLAQSISVAIRNAKLFRSEQAKRLVHDDLQRLFGRISAEVRLDDTLQKLVDELEKILPWDAAAVWLMSNSVDKNNMDQFVSSLHPAAVRINKTSYMELAQAQATGDSMEVDEALQNLEGSDGILLSQYQWVTEISAAKTPVITNKGSAFEPLGEILGFKGEYSAIGAPLFLDNQLLGIIILVHHLCNQYDTETRSIMEVISNYAAIAIENTKLYAVAHDQAWISTVLLQVTEATQSLTNIDDLTQTVVDILPELVGVDACIIFLWDQSVEAFFPQASSGFDKEQATYLDAWNIYAGTAPAFDNLVKNNLPVILDPDTIPENIISEVFSEYDFERDLLILFPLSSQSEIGGAILIDFTNSTLHRDSSQDVWDENYTIIQGVARQTAIALENLQLIKSQEEEAYISIALLQVAQAIVSLNQLDEILGSIVRITPILAGVKRCIIYLWDSKQQSFRQSQSFGISKNDLVLVGQDINADKFPFIDAIRQHNQIIYHALRSEDTPADWNEIASGDYRIVEGIIEESEEVSIRLDAQSLISREPLLIGFPLSVKGEILGFMLIEEESPTKGSPSPHIREKRIEIIKGITQQAAIAIKNELLQQEAVRSEGMERELQLAREIQTTFLPEKLPEIPGWDIGASWQPARQVGGDFYDILRLDEDHVGFVIADVADKGMPAALFMTLIRTLIRAAAKEKSSPARVLKQVNSLLIPDSKHGMFVTVFYAVFSLASGEMIYANAGHNPPIVKQGVGDVLIELTRTSIALGLFDDIEVDEKKISLQVGDWILFYTDGVTEAFSANDEMFGVERLFRILEDTPFVSASELVNKIEQSVNKFISGTDLSDDLTLAVVYRKP